MLAGAVQPPPPPFMLYIKGSSDSPASLRAVAIYTLPLYTWPLPYAYPPHTLNPLYTHILSPAHACTSRAHIRTGLAVYILHQAVWIPYLTLNSLFQYTSDFFKSLCSLAPRSSLHASSISSLKWKWCKAWKWGPAYHKWSGAGNHAEFLLGLDTPS